jgi:Uma2 family endonuclease
VSDTTLEYDRDVKAFLYASHGIPEVWLLDVNAGELTVYREPVEGQYRLIRKPTEAEAVSPVLVAGVAVQLAEVIG